jgi:formamidase
LTRQQAYVLCSVAVDLHINQTVDAPNVWMAATVLTGLFK